MDIDRVVSLGQNKEKLDVPTKNVTKPYSTSMLLYDNGLLVPRRLFNRCSKSTDSFGSSASNHCYRGGTTIT